MDQDANEKAKSRRAILVLYACMAAGVIAPFVVYYILR
jgi:hypothetical protein